MIPDASIMPDLGSTVLHFFWQGSLIAFLVWIALNCLRRESAETRYMVSCVGLGSCLLAFLATMAWETSHQNPIVGATKASSTIQLASIHITFESTGLQGYTAWIWVCGVLLMTTRFAGHCTRAYRLKTRHVSEPDEKWLKIFKSLKKDLKIAPTVRLLRSGLAETPMVVAWITPVILVPASAFVSLTPEQMSAVLAHELAHIHRFDHWINMMQGTIEILLFFHPAIWWISKQIHIEREYCCDNTSIRTTENPKVLAQALAHLEEIRVQTSISLLAANGGSLLDRITRILGMPITTETTKNTNHMKINAIATVVAALFLTGSLITAQGNHPEGKKDNDTKEHVSKKNPNPRVIAILNQKAEAILNQRAEAILNQRASVKANPVVQVTVPLHL
jgi:bla regulator protein blaR1